MKNIIVSEDFHINEFKKFFDEEEVTIIFFPDRNNNKLLHNFKDWNFLKKFKKLKVLELSEARIEEFSDNFFSNLYSIPKLEKFIIDDTSIVLLPKKTFPKDLFPKNLKEYKINFNLRYFTSYKGKHYEIYQGIGDSEEIEYTWDWFTKWLPQIYDFPNIQKLKKLEVLNFYNFFDTESFQGHLFEIIDSLFYKKINIIKSILKKSNLKKINIFGLNFKSENIYDVAIARDEKTGKSFSLYDSEIFRSIAELYSIKKILINEEDPLKYLLKYYKCSNFKEALSLSKTAGIPKGVKTYLT
jgi:hypothetical protein